MKGWVVTARHVVQFVKRQNSTYENQWTFFLKFNIFDAEKEKNVAALIWVSRRNLAHSKWEVKGGSGYSTMRTPTFNQSKIEAL